MISDPRRDPLALRSALEKIPPTQEGLAILQREMNNPAYKDMQFIILAKMNEISELMDSAKGTQPPTMTVKDKIEQQAANASVMADRQRQMTQAQMMQNFGTPQPVDRITQPVRQSQSEDNMALGGIAGQPIDPSMFQFADGGIIAFNGETTSDVKDKDKDKEKPSRFLFPEGSLLGRVQRGNFSFPEGSLLGMFQSATARDPQAQEQIERERQQRAAREAVAGVPAALASAPPTSVSGPPQISPAAMAQGMAPMGLPPQNIAGARRGSQELAAAQQRPPAAPAARPPAAPAAPQAAPAAAMTPAGITALAGALAPTVDYNPLRTAYTEAAPSPFKMEDEIRMREELNKRLGIGSYATAAEKNIAELRRQFEASRPGKDQALMEWLGGISRKGAGAGEAGERVSQFQQRERDAAFAFAQAEFKLKDALEKEREAARIGDRDAILATKKDRETAEQNYRNKKVDLESTIATTEEKRKAAGVSAATQVTTEQMRIDAQSREKALDREIERMKINVQSTANTLAKQDLDFRQTSAQINNLTTQRAKIEELIKKRAETRLGLIDMQLQAKPGDTKLKAERDRIQLELQKEIDDATKPFDEQIMRLEGRLSGSSGSTGNWSVKKKTQ